VIQPLLTTTETIAMFLIAVMAATTLAFGLLASLIITVTDRHTRSRHVTRDNFHLPDPLLPPRAVARRAGDDDRAARLAGPGGAPATVPIPLPDNASPGPWIAVCDTAQIPPVEIDSPDSARGARPSGLPVVRIAACPSCYDGLHDDRAHCPACGRLMEARRLALHGEPSPGEQS
jgi:hypothetical protein